ncbi:hypothetical protein ACTFIY_002083 [Dictyostelium cf. discoideum]
MFTIQTKDSSLECPNELLNSSVLLKEKILDLAVLFDSNLVVPLPNIDLKTLNNIVDFVKLNNEDRYTYLDTIYHKENSFIEIDIILNARFNIQVIAYSYLYYKSKYGHQTFIISVEVDSIDQPWDQVCTIREDQAKIIGGPTLNAFNFTRENDCLSFVVLSDTEALSSPFLFLNFKSIRNDIKRITEMANNVNDFYSLLLHCDQVFGKRSNNSCYNFKCGEVHHFCKRIIDVAKKNKFYLEDVEFLLTESTKTMIYTLHIFLWTHNQGNHFGANFFNDVIENQEVRPQKIFLISKNTDQAKYFWFSKMNFIQKSLVSQKGVKSIRKFVVDDFLKKD